jgi:hypothetical protein
MMSGAGILSSAATVALVAWVAGCGGRADQGNADGGSAGHAGAAGDCVAAGGQCLLGDLICTSVLGPMMGAQMVCPGRDTPGAQYCCLPGNVDCGQPDAATIACPDAATIYPPETLCTGFPTVVPVPEGFAAPLGFDQDAAFPVGCTVTLPFCSAGSLYQCTCDLQASRSGQGVWDCP